jgi:NADH-quinone oxidoreductase subunit C
MGAETPEQTNSSLAPEVLSPMMAVVLERLGPKVLEHRREFGDDRIHVACEHIVEVCRALRDEPKLLFDMLVDLTAVDYFGNPDGFRTEPQVWDAERGEWRRQPQSRHRVPVPARGPEPRFAVVYHLLSTRYMHRLRIKTRVPENDPTIATVTSIWPGANWLERETFDMYGIRFEGHPNLRRIYLYEEFVGHPLRKDYEKEKEQPIQEYVGPGAKEPRRPH